MTNQDLLDTVSEHLLTQMERSAIEVGNELHCRYRGPNGLKCAIGCLIPDEKYKPELETIIASNSAILSAAGLTFEQSALVEELQNIHDGIPVTHWKEHLIVLANKHGLEWKFGFVDKPLGKL